MILITKTNSILEQIEIVILIENVILHHIDVTAIVDSSHSHHIDRMIVDDSPGHMIDKLVIIDNLLHLLTQDIGNSLDLHINQTGYKYDNYRNRTDNKDNNRNPSFDRLSRNQYRSDSSSRYKDRDNQYVKNRSSSRSKNNRTFTREPTPKRGYNRYRSRERSLEIRNKYPDLKYGYNTPYSYNPLEQKFCLKCSFEPNVKVKTHHFFDCRKFMQHNPDICDNCHRGNHMNEECTKKNGYFTKGQNKSVSYLN